MATKIDRLGETRMMNCGMKATIIRYGRSDDVDVRFEDEAIVEHKKYDSFKKGGIANPNIKTSAENRLGETRMMKCDMEATIIRYNNAHDIDVRFEDGTVVEHKGYNAFKKGSIAHPSTTAEDRLGETRIMNCGMEATIIRYDRYDDIDVRFEDGKVVEHRAYNQFKKGGIAYSSTKVTTEEHIGEKRMTNCGLEATIIRYENAKDIDVRFEDGTVIKHKLYRDFKDGKVFNPNFNPRLGETRMMNCSMEATIIRYKNNKDIDIRFEDGTTMEHRKYEEFKNGIITHPSMKTKSKGRLGETRMMNCGMETTVIRYGRCDDIDVRFEDGAIVEHKTYDSFKNGKIANPNIKASVKGRLGETRMMNCGMKATIIRYGKYADIDVRFEDGTVVEHRGYNAFKECTITHQSLSLNYGSKDFHGFVCKRGFIDEGRTLYECICKHCGLEDVLTPQEMIEHEKSEHRENK